MVNSYVHIQYIILNILQQKENAVHNGATALYLAIWLASYNYIAIDGNGLWQLFCPVDKVTINPIATPHNIFVV